METCLSCNRNEFSFSFSKENKNWEQALHKCRQMDGTLANNLRNRDYRHLNSCLRQCNVTSQGHQYWIGLVNWPNNCTNSSNVYHWVDEQECINPSPLEVVSQPSNNACRSVTLTIDNSGKFPSATDLACSNAHRFICKKSLEFPTTATSSAATKTQKLPLTLQTATPTNFTRKATAFFNNSTSRSLNNEKLAGVALTAIGVVIGLLFLVILLVILYCRYRKLNSEQISTKIFINRKKSRNVVSAVNVAVTQQAENQERIYEVMNATPPPSFNNATNGSFTCTPENAPAKSGYEVLHFPKPTAPESTYQIINDNLPVCFENSVDDERRVSVVDILYDGVRPQQIVGNVYNDIHNSSIQTDARSGEYDTFNRGISIELEPKEKFLNKDQQVEDTALYSLLDIGCSTNNSAPVKFQQKQKTENPASNYDQLYKN